MKRMLVVDFSAFLTYALAALPSLTGVPAHEWFGLALLAPVFVHCAQHVDRVARALPRCVREARLRNCGRLALDAALLVALSTVFVSGLGMSGTVLQTFGLYAEGYYTWSPLACRGGEGAVRASSRAYGRACGFAVQSAETARRCKGRRA